MAERLTFDAFLNLTEIITDELDTHQVLSRSSIIKLFAKHTQFEAPTKNEVAMSKDTVSIKHTKNTTTGRIKFKKRKGNNKKGSPGKHEYIEKGKFVDTTSLISKVYNLAIKSSFSNRFLASKVKMKESTLVSAFNRVVLHNENSKAFPTVKVMESVVPKLAKMEQFLIKEKEKVK